VPIIPAKTVRSKQYEIVFPEIYAKFMPLSIAGEVRNVKTKTCGTNSNLFRGLPRMKIGW
jgi:CRISPR/Cas system-associated protein Csx1